MRRICQRFECWRKEHKACLPIPEALWAEAARARGFRAARAVRLGYRTLKRMVETGPAPARATLAPATFLELMPSKAARHGYSRLTGLEISSQRDQNI
jgi:hypothetical protein